MPTALINRSAKLNAIAQLIYTVPTNTVAIALNTVIANTTAQAVAVTLYKEAGGVIINLIPTEAQVFPGIDYRPPLEKLVLEAGDKLFARAGSLTPQARATGLFGLPTMLDPLAGGAIADFSISIAERS